MMILRKIELDYERTLGYVISSLSDANVLSNEILKSIDFKDGSFFTLLHKDFLLDNIYDFSSYLIFHDNYKLSVDDSVSETIRLDLSKKILSAIQSNCDTYCVVDDFMRDDDEEYTGDLLKGEMYLNNNQVYYILDRDNISLDGIKVCLHRSYAFWHSLCLLTTANLKVRERKLSEKTLHDIALHTQLIMVVAYDGDGYVLWQRSDHNYF